MPHTLIAHSWRHPVLTSGCILGMPSYAISSANANAVVHYHVLFKRAFHFGILPSKPFLFPKICTFEFMLYRGKPTMNWFFPHQSMWPIDQIKDWFQLHTSIRRWTQEWIKTEIMQNGFEIYTKTERVSKTGKILSKNRTFLAKTGGLESLLKYVFNIIFLKCIFEFMINTAPTTSNSVHSRENRRVGISIQICLWDNFPQMYLWIHDKYSFNNFKQCSQQRKML